MSAYDRMGRTFADAGLVAPPIPDPLREALVERGPWHWATRDVEPMEMYMLFPYVDALLNSAVDDHVAVTHAGHGANSYSLNLGVKVNGLLMAVQTLWGGVYTDEAVAAERWRHLMEACGSLLAAHQAAMGSGKAPERNLLVVDSDFRTTRICAWLDVESDHDVRSLVGAERPSLDPIREATQMLAAA